MTASVLVVCTGNICRSPAIERLLRLHLDNQVPVESAGTHALVGYPIDDPMADYLAAAGADVDGFIARQLRPDMIARSSIVVVAAREHRSSVVRLVPGAVHRTFTLLELVRLSSTVSAPPTESIAQRVSALAGRAAAQRSRHLGHRDPDDIEDPYGRRRAAYRKSYRVIEDAVTALATTLRPNLAPTRRRR